MVLNSCVKMKRIEIKMPNKLHCIKFVKLINFQPTTHKLVHQHINL